MKHQEKVSADNIFTEYLSVSKDEGATWQWEKLGEAGLDLSDLESLKQQVEIIKNDYLTEADKVEIEHYADDQDAETLAAANVYADGKAATAESNAKAYADSQDTTNLASAKAYAD